MTDQTRLAAALACLGAAAIPVAVAAIHYRAPWVAAVALAILCFGAQVLGGARR